MLAVVHWRIFNNMVCAAVANVRVRSNWQLMSDWYVNAWTRSRGRRRQPTFLGVEPDNAPPLRVTGTKAGCVLKVSFDGAMKGRCELRPRVNLIPC